MSQSSHSDVLILGGGVIGWPEPALEKMIWLLKFAGKCNRTHLRHAIVACEAF